MSKVVNTDCLGSQLTGRVFARTLEPGDLIVSGTGIVIEVLGSRQDDQLNAGAIIVKMRTRRAIHPGCAGMPYEVPYGINQSVDRIVVARSAGQIN
jgi:hypothetical protein